MAADGEQSSTSRVASTCSFSTTVAIFIICSMSRARAGLFVGVFRAFAWTMAAAHALRSPTVAPVRLAATMRARKASGVRREKRGSREGGDHGFA